MAGLGRPVLGGRSHVSASGFRGGLGQMVETFLPGSSQVVEEQSGRRQPGGGAGDRDEDGTETRMETGASLCGNRRRQRLQSQIKAPDTRTGDTRDRGLTNL